MSGSSEISNLRKECNKLYQKSKIMGGSTTNVARLSTILITERNEVSDGKQKLNLDSRIFNSKSSGNLNTLNSNRLQSTQPSSQKILSTQRTDSLKGINSQRSLVSLNIHINESTKKNSNMKGYN